MYAGWQRSRTTHPPFQSLVRELYQFVVLSTLSGNMEEEQSINLEQAEKLKEEANEYFKSNKSCYYTSQLAFVYSGTHPLSVF